MTVFRLHPRVDAARGFFQCCDESFHRFTIRHFSPAIHNGFTPPADNIHAHNVPGVPGYDPRCTALEKPIPARFAMICPKCGQGWFIEAAEGDLQIAPDQLIDRLSAKLSADLKAAIPNPVLRLAVGNLIQTHIRRFFMSTGLRELLAEIPARGAPEVVQNFVAQFIPLP